MPTYSKTLDCQDCGKILLEISNAEAQKVADNPENYIIFCKDCAKDYYK